MARRNEVKAKVRQLTSGYWAVFINDTWVDAASPSKDAALAKLKQLLLKMKGESK